MILMTDLTQAIRFRFNTRYGLAGQVNTALDWGVKSTLVSRGAAEWVIAEPEPVQDASREIRKHKSDKRS